ncbi:MAG: sigma-54-dependent Fis family transcriptional regulator [Deltaproteobacteria bacterium]|nr:sigma-54-dependent Fis family transcriptional regulator [Deltaproteobacteria bacterium]
MGAGILLIEDDAAGRALAVFNLTKAGYDVTAVADGQLGLDTLTTQNFDLVITDVKMPGLSGIDVLNAIGKSHPNLPVIIITAYANVAMAVDAMKLGAEDFIGKPFTRDHLLLVVSKALKHRALKNELNQLRARAGGIERPILSKSGQMRQVIEMTDRFAVSDASVLVTGRSGTGKELIARRIHARSSRRDHPFVPVNLAALPENLIESELFGHEKGAFTGAVNTRIGRFRQADRGTIFLDEIAELPFQLQGKLLRVLQEKTVDSVGSDAPVMVDVRVVAATNRDLEKEVAAGRFREDLYYRINVVQIEIPPLVDRPDDIEPLVRQFVGIFSEGRTLDIPDVVMSGIRAHSWPGNVRELENVCQRLVLLAPGDALRASDLPFGKTAPSEKKWHVDDIPLPAEGISLMDVEKEIIEKALRLQGGNVSKTATWLQIPRHVLAYRMEKFGIEK